VVVDIGAALIFGQGNFGSMDGDSPAAMRYTEARMRKITDEVMADIDKETIDWTNNFDDTIPGADGAPHQDSAAARQWRERHRRGHGHQHGAP